MQESFDVTLIDMETLSPNKREIQPQREGITSSDNEKALEIYSALVDHPSLLLKSFQERSPS